MKQKAILFKFLILSLILLKSTCMVESEMMDCSQYNYAHNHGHSINHPQSAVLDQFIKEKVRLGLVGVSMMVASPQGTWYGAAGKVSLECGKDFQPSHYSRIGSITKTYTAVMILRLSELGIVNLDDSITKYLPGRITDEIAHASVITIRQLLNHTSGIYSYTDILSFGLDLLNNPYQLNSEEDLLKYISGKPGYFLPGESMHYSNTNFLLLGLIVENAYGKNLKNAFVDLLKTPLSLNHTFLDPDHMIPEGTSQGYLNMDSNGDITNATDYLMGQYADGGIVANVFDMYTFMNSLVNGAILLPITLTEMKTWVDVEQPEFGLTKYGLGLRYWSTPYGGAYGHTGGSWGYLAEMFYFPDHDTYFILLVNGSLGKFNEIVDFEIHKKIPELLFSSLVP
ncbi:MAG: beta-lactamase family protein [Spirochaetia bacterium]|nr:beta-lactamase family protein [Spirochaetia bacterium]